MMYKLSCRVEVQALSVAKADITTRFKLSENQQERLIGRQKGSDAKIAALKDQLRGMNEILQKEQSSRAELLTQLAASLQVILQVCLAKRLKTRLLKFFCILWSCCNCVHKPLQDSCITLLVVWRWLKISGAHIMRRASDSTVVRLRAMPRLIARVQVEESAKLQAMKDARSTRHKLAQTEVPLLSSTYLTACMTEQQTWRRSKLMADTANWLCWTQKLSLNK